VTTAYADKESVGDVLTVNEATGEGLKAAIENMGWEVQAVNWVFEQVTGENLVQAIIAPITGDFEKVRVNAEAWRAVGAAMDTIATNLSHNVALVRDNWSGTAALAHEAFIQTAWRGGLFVEKQVAELIARGFDKVADGSQKLAEQALRLIEYLVRRLVDAAAKVWIPAYGWVKAAELVWDAYQIYQRIVRIIEAIQQLVESAKGLMESLQGIKSALSEIKDVNSVSDVINIAMDVKDNVQSAQEQITAIGDSVNTIRDDATGLRNDAREMRNDARDLRNHLRSNGNTNSNEPATSSTAP